MTMDDQAIIGGLVNRNILEIDYMDRQTMLQIAQEVLRRAAEYTDPASTVQ